MKKILAGFFGFIILYSLSSIASATEGKVVAYYFHGNTRCTSCKKIEQFTDNVMQNVFYNELDNKQLSFKTMNVDEKVNKHFMQDYQLYTRSVVLSLVKNGKEVKFKNLDQVWNLLRSEEKFYQYIEAETQLFLNELKGREQ